MAFRSDAFVAELGLTPRSWWTVLRAVLNWINLSTLSGLLIAVIGRAQLTAGPRLTIVATDYRWSFPSASAFTLGNVIVSRKSAETLERQPALMRHEDRHCSQYAVLVGLPLLPVHLLASAISFALTGGPAQLNPFERLAGLRDGGYAERRLRWSQTPVE